MPSHRSLSLFWPLLLGTAALARSPELEVTDVSFWRNLGDGTDLPERVTTRVGEGGAAAGARVHFQSWFLDPAAAESLAATQGWAATQPW
jgi:hypothetical protein